MGKHQLLIMLLFMFACSTEECEEQSQEGYVDWAKHMIPHNYNPKLPPRHLGCPAQVNLTMAPWGIGEISIKHMNFEVNVYVIFNWIDFRLNISNPVKETLNFEEKYAANIWTPDVAFRNCMRCSVIRFDHRNHKLSLQGNVLTYFVRANGRLFCKFDITNYPMDRHNCYIEVETFGDLKDSVILKNDPFAAGDIFLREPYVPEFKISNLISGECSVPDFTSNFVTCVQFRFTLTRELAFHLMLTYAPSFLIVLLTWISFWLEVDVAPPRIALGLTSLLTLATQFANAQKDLPSVSYAKAVDIWMFTCLFMVFGSLIEFAIAYNVERNKEKQLALRPIMPRKPKPQKQNKESSIDSASKFMFPLTFLVFNVCYWGYFCTR